MLKDIPRGRYVAVLGGLFAILFAFSAYRPLDTHAWWLENVLVFLSVGYLVATYRRLPLSRISYTLIFLFLCLHETGAHWTYAEVPYDAFTRDTFGFSFNELMGWERNHFDRLVHFLYGFLIAYPIREVFVRVAQVRGFWGYFLPLDLTMSTSMIFELFEWVAAEFFGGDLGIAYLGSQGDVWDAHKDMLLASVGALLAMLITAWINSRAKRDFAADFADSLRVKAGPLGEEALARMKRRRE
jgi:putative membrane protein